DFNVENADHAQNGPPGQDAPRHALGGLIADEQTAKPTDRAEKRDETESSCSRSQGSLHARANQVRRATVKRIFTLHERSAKSNTFFTVFSRYILLVHCLVFPFSQPQHHSFTNAC